MNGRREGCRDEVELWELVTGVRKEVRGIYSSLRGAWVEHENRRKVCGLGPPRDDGHYLALIVATMLRWSSWRNLLAHQVWATRWTQLTRPPIDPAQGAQGGHSDLGFRGFGSRVRIWPRRAGLVLASEAELGLGTLGTLICSITPVTSFSMRLTISVILYIQFNFFHPLFI